MVTKQRISRSSGFTLIEIVIVVSIVGVLSAILFPVVSTARRRAQAASCLSNLHQIGLATRLYADDYDGRYLYAINATTRREDEDIFIPAELIPQLPNYTDVLSPYLKSKAAFRCPSDTGGDFYDEKIDNAFDEWETSYSYNEFLVFYFPRDKMEAIDPAKLDLFRDMGYWHDNEGENTLETNRFVQVVYADLHVKKTRIYDVGTWAGELEEIIEDE